MKKQKIGDGEEGREKKKKEKPQWPSIYCSRPKSVYVGVGALNQIRRTSP